MQGVLPSIVLGFSLGKRSGHFFFFLLICDFHTQTAVCAAHYYIFGAIIITTFVFPCLGLVY